ncbi:MAG: hypothetical protein GF310_08760 [candidate division Zixibacteria bacterium]|nr:hypothetical protein [candidate division Zixibacteria bacterium]
MTEKKRKKIVYGIFVIAVIWGIFNFPFGRRQNDNVSPEDRPYPEEGEIQKALVSGQGSISNPDFTADWGDDPFAQKTAKPQPSSKGSTNLSLSAISKSGDDFWALINGKALTKGDQINGWKLIEIAKTSARLSKDGKTIILNIEGV